MTSSVPSWLLENPLGVSVDSDAVLTALDPALVWEQRFRGLISLGDQMPRFPGSERVAENRLHGCQALVWVSHARDADSGLVYLSCDSDARLIRGLIACVICGYNAQTPEAMLAFDAKSFLKTLDFSGHIASERTNGLLALIGKARLLAHRYSSPFSQVKF